MDRAAVACQEFHAPVRAPSAHQLHCNACSTRGLHVMSSAEPSGPTHARHPVTISHIGKAVHLLGSLPSLCHVFLGLVLPALCAGLPANAAGRCTRHGRWVCGSMCKRHPSTHYSMMVTSNVQCRLTGYASAHIHGKLLLCLRTLPLRSCPHPCACTRSQVCGVREPQGGARQAVRRAGERRGLKLPHIM